MTNQKLVLEQITALNTTTCRHDRFDRRDAAEQTGKIHEQAAQHDPARDAAARVPEYLRHDGPGRHLQGEALENMKQTVETLSTEVEKSKGYIARAEGVNQGQACRAAIVAIDAARIEMTEITRR